MAALNVLVYIATWLVSAAMVVTALLSCVFLVAEHRACRRRLAAPVTAGPPLPDPDIAWALADDPDPAAVARLQKELARPLAELITEGERKAIAMAHPLKGNPSEARVVDPPLTREQAEVLRKRLLESTRPALVLPQDGIYAFGGGGGGFSATYTVPAGAVTVNKDAWRAGGGRHEPEVLGVLREQRCRVYQAAQQLANAACAADRPFNDAETREWGTLMGKLEVIDRRIAAILEIVR
jgi:hypothetical protein